MYHVCYILLPINAEGDMFLSHLAGTSRKSIGVSYVFILIMAHCANKDDVDSVSYFIPALYQLLVLFIISF